MSEGSSLISIQSEVIQMLLKNFIKTKVDAELKEFQPPYATDVDNYWVGGNVRQINEWKWISNLHNLSAYSKWKDKTEGNGCVPPGFCLDSQGLLIQAPKFEWTAADKANEYPYICESGCSFGYIWQKTAKKCVKIIRDDEEKRSHSAASLYCAKDNPC